MSSRDGLPNFVNGGVTKAGTTSLYGYLSQHPEVCPADRKDLNHYSPMRLGDEPTESLDDYAAHFAHCQGEAYRFESSPDYFTGGWPLVERLDRELPAARVVIVLRDPVRRLWSSYTYKRSRATLPPGTTFREMFEADLEACRAGRDRTSEGQHHRTLSTGFYAEHLLPWFEVLGTERVRVVFFEHLAADPRAEVQDLCRWLDIDPGPADGMDLGVHNPTVQPRSHTVRRLAEWVNATGDGLLRRMPGVEDRLRHLYARINGRPQPERFSADDQRRVADLYADSNRHLVDLLTRAGYRRLPPWLPTDRTDR